MTRTAPIIRSVFFSIFFASPTVSASQHIICDATSWFDSKNGAGTANWTFSFELKSSNGYEYIDDITGLNCERLDDASVLPSNIFIECSKPPLPLMKSLGRHEVLVKIDRNNGTFSSMQSSQNSETFTIYDGQCRVGSKKF
jgi:hypothetical protein